LLKLRLDSTSTDLGKVTYKKVVYNFGVFPESIYTPLYDKQSRSNDHWKSRGAAENSSVQDKITRTDIFGVESSSRRKPKETQNTKVIGNFPSFSRRGVSPDFGIGRRDSKP
jgi:hypothetical protein